MLVTILHAVRNVLETDEEIRQKVPLYISSRGQRGQDVLKALKQYHGPEEDTVAELALHHDMWLEDPPSFWRAQTTPDFSGLMPEAQIVACFIVRSRSDK